MDGCNYFFFRHLLAPNKKATRLDGFLAFLRFGFAFS
jgi:hypothetical protein